MLAQKGLDNDMSAAMNIKIAILDIENGRHSDHPGYRGVLSQCEELEEMLRGENLNDEMVPLEGIVTAISAAKCEKASQGMGIIQSDDGPAFQTDVFGTIIAANHGALLLLGPGCVGHRVADLVDPEFQAAQLREGDSREVQCTG